MQKWFPQELVCCCCCCLIDVVVVVVFLLVCFFYQPIIEKSKNMESSFIHRGNAPKY